MRVGVPTMWGQRQPHMDGEPSHTRWAIEREQSKEKREGDKQAMIYHTCPLCGANLDPGERCDCENNWMKVELPPASEDGQTDGKENKPCQEN